jgi:hypothetical protein
MHNDSRPQRTIQVLDLSSRDNFLNREIVTIRVFTMKERCGDPDFGGNGYIDRGNAVRLIHLII